MSASITVRQNDGMQRWRPSNSRKQDATSSVNSISELQEEALIRNAAIDVELEGESLSSPGLYKRLVLDLLRQSESSVHASLRKPAQQGKVAPALITVTMSEEQRQAAVRLIDQWLADDSGYDQEVWPILKQSIEENRLSYRRRFHE